MRSRPKELITLALVFLGNALYYSVQTARAFPVLEHGSTESELLSFSILGLSWILIPLALRASRMLWAVSILSGTLILWRGSSALPLFSVVTISLLTAILISASCRHAFFHPSRRWWLTPARKRAALRTRLRPVLGGEILSETFDISEGGLFIGICSSTHWHRAQAKLKQTPENSLQVGTYCWVRITLTEFSSLTCTAEVVRKSECERGNYPAGIGLRFVGLTAQDKKILSQFLSSTTASTESAPPSKQHDEQLAA